MANDTSGVDTAQAQALKKACDEAYIDSLGKNSCSHAVWYVLKAITSKDEPYRTANALIAYLTQSSLWRDAKLDELSTLANQGIVVVGGKTETEHGHVIVVYPGKPIPGGGYLYPHTDHKGVKKMLVMGSHGMKPPCLSTSSGPWPGAKSKGDKTIFDPWGDEKKFSQVKFWTPATK